MAQIQFCYQTVVPLVFCDSLFGNTAAAKIRSWKYSNGGHYMLFKGRYKLNCSLFFFL